MQHRVRLSFNVAANRPRHHTGIAADCELVPFELLHATAVIHNKDNVSLAGADLKSNTAAFNTDGRRRGPSFALVYSPSQHALSVFRADDKSSALQVRHD